MEKIEVPRSTLGYLIGKRGCHVQSLSRKSGARLIVSWKNATVTVVGTPHARAHAKKLIETAIDEALSQANIWKTAKLIYLGDGFSEKGVKGVRFERYQGRLDKFHEGKTFYRLFASGHDDGETVENKDDISAKTVESLCIADKTGADMSAHEETATSEKMTSWEEFKHQSQVIRNTGHNDVVEFTAREIIKYANEEAYVDDRNLLVIKMSFGYKLFLPLRESFDVAHPLSFAELSECNISFNGDVSTFFLQELPQGIAANLWNQAQSAGYTVHISNESMRIFHVRLMNFSSTLRVVNDKKGQERLEILSFSKERKTIATADILSPTSGMDKRLKIHVEPFAELPEWYVNYVGKMRISPSGCELVLPKNVEPLLPVSSIRYRQFNLFSARFGKRESKEQSRDSCTGEVVSSPGRDVDLPSEFELSRECYNDDSEHSELALRPLSPSMPMKITKNISRKEVENFVGDLLKESDRLAHLFL